LTEKFVPATDEVWRLQQGSDPECLFFQEMADHGHYGGRPGQSRQGIYVCSPSGKFLASINSNNPDRVLEMMQRGLSAWNNLPEPERRLGPDSKIKPQHRWEDSIPIGGLVLNMITRDLPLQCDPKLPCEVKWNQDAVWFSKAESRQWLPQNPQPGDQHVLPEELIVRLARLHLVDTVNGQTSPLSRRAVNGSTISTEVVEREGARVKIKIVGTTRGNSTEERLLQRESPHGVVTRLIGHAVYDLEREAFVEFEMVALGRRWGHTQFNARRRGAQSGPLGYVFTMAPRNAAPIAPAFISDYDVDWVKRPERRR
jgi:hypothetical protein